MTRKQLGRADKTKTQSAANCEYPQDGEDAMHPPNITLRRPPMQARRAAGSRWPIHALCEEATRLECQTSTGVRALGIADASFR
jgi:hypothetical protein